MEGGLRDFPVEIGSGGEIRFGQEMFGRDGAKTCCSRKSLNPRRGGAVGVGFWTRAWDWTRQNNMVSVTNVFAELRRVEWVESESWLEYEAKGE